MSPSSAHYLARMQTRDSKVDPPIVAAAQELFAVPDDEKMRDYVDHLNSRIKSIVSSAVESDGGPDQAETEQAVQDIYTYFQNCGFSVEELFAKDEDD